MDTGLLMQYVIIGLAATVSIGYVLTTQWPGVIRRIRVACALVLMRTGRPLWTQRIGRRLAPVASVSPACGGCSSCD